MNDWTLTYDRYDPEREGVREALCTLGNGYLCTRGAAPDCADDDQHYPGSYVAGLYNRRTSTIKGREIENEDLVNLPNWLVLTLRINGGEWVRFDDLELIDYAQELCLRDGTLTRRLRLRDGEGRTIRWHERRFVSMSDKHLAAVALEITAEDWAGRVEVRSALDGTVINNNVARYRDLASCHLEPLGTEAPQDDVILLRVRTNASRIEIAEAARTRIYRNGIEVDAVRRTEEREGWVEQDLALDLGEGETVSVEKIAAVFTSRDDAIAAPAIAACEAVADAPRFEELHGAHAEAWQELWDDFDMVTRLRDLDHVEMKLRLHVFHLLQSVCENAIDSDIGVPARGWHGEAYRGHIFWDELFILPLLNFRRPVVTRALLKYRFRRLGAARKIARESGFEGALFPWQSGSDGREETQVLHLNPKSGDWVPDNSHRQRHVNAAIAYNVWRYYEVTGDREFMRDYGAEMYLEIARFWASIAEERPDGRFGIREVMGPDEFQTGYPGLPPEEERGIDNNAYTNVMACFVLRHAADVLEILPQRARHRLCTRLGIDGAERARWDRISRSLYVPFHDDAIISQFEGYEKLKEFDWDGYREKYGDIQRLDRILGAEGKSVNDYKASKQADVLMLFYLFSTEELALLFERLGYDFQPDMITKNIDYYLARTSHGSTLSHVVHSWVLIRSIRPMSWKLLGSALDADIADIQGGTTQEGIHLGAMAGTVDIFQRCLTGLDVKSGILLVNPLLPEGLDEVRLRIQFRGQDLEIVTDRNSVEISAQPTAAAPVTVSYRGHYRDLAPGDSTRFHLIERPARQNAQCDENRRQLEAADPLSCEE
ncbi:putative glycosyl hydrolase/MT2062 [Jannaschia seosinensis]|uniref:Putative glycosyl hydrolase/MT2062 n=1 Tax=Jannaschia seosinensis TaxID=313367 RepID=A0A0M7BCP6_9RHOB|nr:glycosyl hydrolase family 65 protein [Jannaschia seosinensis]CUH40510.1 putative glycosyl hydrolase/MT2062 [Jannaschia seosinensis]